MTTSPLPRARRASGFRGACIVAAFTLTVPAWGETPDAEYEIAAAALALPPSLADAVTVLGTDAQGEMLTLREGSVPISCKVDSVERDDLANRLMVACMPDALDPLRDRIRALLGENPDLDRTAMTAQLKAEAAAGTLALPEAPVTGYVYLGGVDSYGVDLDELDGSRWQTVFVPFATGETLGLPSAAEGTMPWVMAGGSAYAHIMVFGDPAMPAE